MTPKQTALFDEYQLNVYKLAHQLRARLPQCVELDDLIADGRVGLLQAVRAYEPAKGVPFWGFAAMRVHGAMLDGTRQDAGKRRYRRAPVKFVRLNHGRGSTADAVSLDQAERSRIERMADQRPSPEAMAIDQDGRRFLLESIEAFPCGKTRDVVRAILQGEPRASIANRHGRTENWASRRVALFVTATRRQLRRSAR